MNFKEAHATRPDQKDIGSSGYSRLKHLWTICKELQPTRIIESGSWKGNSSYIFFHACPEAQLVCHDINFSNLKWRHPNIKYIEADIETMPYEGGYDDLVFFDDHVDQMRRLNWAIQHGFHYLLFDDNVSAKEAAKLKAPPVPTLQMGGAGGTVLPYLGRDTRDTKLTLLKV